MMVMAKLARLAGIDQLHTGTIVGKMEGTKKEIKALNKFCQSEWAGLEKVLPIASGGLHPRLVSELMRLLGHNVIINFGGGAHGHPGGIIAGVRAAKESIEASSKGISLSKWAKTHFELNQALKYWK